MVRDRRIARRMWLLFSFSLFVLSTNCAYADKVARLSSSGDGQHLDIMLCVTVIIGFLCIGGILAFLEHDRRKRIEQTFAAEIDHLRQQVMNQIDQARTGSLPAITSDGVETTDTLKEMLLREVDKKLESYSKSLMDNINTVDTTLSRQVQEITGSVTKQVKQISETMAKQNFDVTETLSKEVFENSETRFNHLRSEYKGALKAMAKVVDQQMSTLQKAIADNHREQIELLCASKFADLLDDRAGRVDASIELIRKHASEDKIIELAQRFPSSSVIHILRLLSGKTPSPEVAERLIKSSLAVVDELMDAQKFDEAAAVSVQIIDAGRQLGLSTETLLPIARRVAHICKTTRNIEIAEQLHEQFVRLSSDGTGSVTPGDVEEMLEMYKAVYPVEKAADMHRRIHHCMQAFGRSLDTDSLSNLAELAHVLTSESKFDEALVVLTDIATGLSKTDSPIDDKLHMALQTAVKDFVKSGRLEEAAEIDWLLLDTYKAKNAKESIAAVLSDLQDVANEYAVQGNFSVAAAIHKRRRQSLVEGAGSDAEQLAALNDVAETYLKAEQWENLAALMPDMVAIYKETYGDQSEEAIERVAFAADVYAKVRQYDLATTLVEQGLIAATKVWGDFGDKTVSMLNMLADLYTKQARYTDAETLYRRVLDHQEKVQDQRLSKSYTHLGDTLSLQKDYEGAEQYFKKALDALEATAGAEHPDVLTPLVHLASLYMTAGRYKDAEPCYKRILEIKYKTHGEHSEEIITSLIHLGELYNIQANFAEAEVFMETALETAHRLYTHEDGRLGDVMMKYAQVLAQLGKDTEAAKLHARAEKIKSGSLNDEAAEALS